MSAPTPAQARVARALAIAERIWQRHDRGLRNVLVVRHGGAVARGRRQLRLYRDTGGLYVRVAKRGQIKLYLAAVPDARVVDAGLDIVEFIEALP